MNTFDERKKGFEAKYLQDQEAQFKVRAIRNKLVGQWAASLVKPNGKLSVSIKNLILIINIKIPPIYPRANPKPEDLPRFLFLEISFNKEL